MQEFILIALLGMLIIFLAGAVMIRDLLYAVLSLAAGSVVLAVILFMMMSHWAASFELFAGAGIMSVIFLMLIKYTNARENNKNNNENKSKNHLLPLLLLAVFFFGGALLLTAGLGLYVPEWLQSSFAALQKTIWDKHQTDIIGLAFLLLSGSVAAVIIFKSGAAKTNEKSDNNSESKGRDEA